MVTSRDSVLSALFPTMVKPFQTYIISYRDRKRHHYFTLLVYSEYVKLLLSLTGAFVEYTSAGMTSGTGLAAL